MTAKIKIKDIDKGFSKIVGELNANKNSRIKVGVQSNEKSKQFNNLGAIVDGPDSLAEVAAKNEFGDGNIPSRPFMRNTFDKNIAEVKSIFDSEYSKILANKSSFDLSLKKIGVYYVSLIQKEITDLREPENSPVTIARKSKGGVIKDNPLISTGQLRNSIKYVIEK